MTQSIEDKIAWLKKYDDANTVSFKQLEEEASVRINRAKALGWTEISYTYDDMWGGIYLGGVNPSGKWSPVPELIDMSDQPTNQDKK
jgi:hypothetical protein